MAVLALRLLLLIHMLSTVVNCQWTVDVQLHQFQNKYNAEIKDGENCCCDTNHCVNALSSPPNNCVNQCDTWFSINITPCKAVGDEMLQCSVSTESETIMNSPSIGEYGYIFHFSSNVQPEEVTIKMWEAGGGGGDNKIDNFTVMLSLSLTNIITSYTGEKNIAVIELSYQIQCLNLDNCPSTSLSTQNSLCQSQAMANELPLTGMTSYSCVASSLTTICTGPETTTITLTESNAELCHCSEAISPTVAVAVNSCTYNIPSGGAVTMDAISMSVPAQSTVTLTETVIRMAVSMSCGDGLSTTTLTAVSSSLDNGSVPEVLESERIQVIWMAVAIVSLLLAITTAGTAAVCAVMYCKKGEKLAVSKAYVNNSHGGTDNPLYDQSSIANASLAKYVSVAENDVYIRVDNGLNGQAPDASNHCYVESGPIETQEESLYDIATPGEEGGADECVEMARDYETPRPLDSGRKQDLGEYSTLQH